MMMQKAGWIFSGVSVTPAAQAGAVSSGASPEKCPMQLLCFVLTEGSSKH